MKPEVDLKVELEEEEVFCTVLLRTFGVLESSVLQHFLSEGNEETRACLLTELEDKKAKCLNQTIDLQKLLLLMLDHQATADVRKNGTSHDLLCKSLRDARNFFSHGGKLTHKRVSSCVSSAIKLLKLYCASDTSIACLEDCSSLIKVFVCGRGKKGKHLSTHAWRVNTFAVPLLNSEEHFESSSRNVCSYILLKPPKLIGRERELTELEERLSRDKDGRASQVLILGQPGIGKTALVLNVVVTMRKLYPRQFILRGSSLAALRSDLRNVSLVFASKKPGMELASLCNLDDERDLVQSLGHVSPSLLVIEDANDKVVLDFLSQVAMVSVEHTLLFVSSRSSAWTDERKKTMAITSTLHLCGLSDHHAMQLLKQTIHDNRTKLRTVTLQQVLESECDLAHIMTESFNNVPLAIKTVGRLLSTGDVDVESVLQLSAWLRQKSTNLENLEGSGSLVVPDHVRGISGIVEYYLSALPDCPLVKTMLFTLCMVDSSTTPVWLVKDVLLGMASSKDVSQAFQSVLDTGLVQFHGPDQLLMPTLFQAVIKQKFNISSFEESQNIHALIALLSSFQINGKARKDESMPHSWSIFLNSLQDSVGDGELSDNLSQLHTDFLAANEMASNSTLRKYTGRETSKALSVISRVPVALTGNPNKSSTPNSLKGQFLHHALTSTMPALSEFFQQLMGDDVSVIEKTQEILQLFREEPCLIGSYHLFIDKLLHVLCGPSKASPGDFLQSTDFLEFVQNLQLCKQDTQAVGENVGRMACFFWGMSSSGQKVQPEFLLDSCAPPELRNVHSRLQKSFFLLSRRKDHDKWFSKKKSGSSVKRNALSSCTCFEHVCNDREEKWLEIRGYFLRENWEKVRKLASPNNLALHHAEYCHIYTAARMMQTAAELEAYLAIDSSLPFLCSLHSILDEFFEDAQITSEVLAGTSNGDAAYCDITLVLWISLIQEKDPCARRRVLSILQLEGQRAHTHGAAHFLQTAKILSACSLLLYLQGSSHAILETVCALLLLLNWWLAHCDDQCPFFAKENRSELELVKECFETAQADLLEYVEALPDFMKREMAQQLRDATHACWQNGEAEVAELFQDQLAAIF